MKVSRFLSDNDFMKHCSCRKNRPQRPLRLLAFSALLLLLFAQPTDLSALERLAVLVYHHLEDPTTSDVSCTPAQFEAQMQGLLKAGFQPLNLAEARAFLLGLRPNLRRPVLITFDDGYESLYDHALPVARRLKIPMTVFVVTSRIGLQPQFSRYLSGSQIREMADSGYFEFGSHTHDQHTDNMRLYQAFSTLPNPVEALMNQDLRASRDTLANIVGKAPIAIAWPYGKFNSNLRRIAQANGFQLHFTSLPGYNEPGTNPYAIKRLPVTSRDTVTHVLRKAGGL